MQLDQKANILLVDDNENNIFVLAIVLEELDQHIVKAYSGADAIRSLLHNEFAVIILDVNLPDINGYELASLIRENERTKHTPIIFLSGNSPAENKVKFTQGPVEHLIKPVDANLIKNKVGSYIDSYFISKRANRAREQQPQHRQI